jgi:hypothetical protein
MRGRADERTMPPKTVGHAMRIEIASAIHMDHYGDPDYNDA